MLNTTVTIPILIIIPIVRIVATDPEAIPKKRFSTELMIAFVLGEENRAKNSNDHLNSLVLLEPINKRSTAGSVQRPGICKESIVGHCVSSSEGNPDAVSTRC